ncbi:MAG: DUF1353 domain-containing protein [Desulfobulbaceae bacterium]|nr:DUF1353 domain-containing protein [Desulfobulbaceae bacterium]
MDWQRKTEKKGFRIKKIEKKTWGFYSRDHEGPWINYINYPLIKRTTYAKNKRFYSEWLIIHDGIIIVNPGVATVELKERKAEYDYSKKRTYAWDGCTPKRFFFWVALIGTPDWWNKEETILTLSKSHEIEKKIVFWQRALHASLVHDALYQYLDSIPIAKMQVNQLFFEMLRDSGFSWPLAKTYHLAVRLLGARDIKENTPKENSNFTVSHIPK